MNYRWGWMFYREFHAEVKWCLEFTIHSGDSCLQEQLASTLSAHWHHLGTLKYCSRGPIPKDCDLLVWGAAWTSEFSNAPQVIPTCSYVSEPLNWGIPLKKGRQPSRNACMHFHKPKSIILTAWEKWWYNLQNESIFRKTGFEGNLN